MSRAAVVYNPLAGSGQGALIAAQAEQHLSSHGIVVECVATRDRSGATEIVRRVAADIDLLVVAGGDGSLRESIVGLGEERRRVKIGLLPMGNSNVVARELGIPLDPVRAVQLLTEGAPCAVDLGSVNSELFLAMVGIGWDALAVRYLDIMRHTRLGRLWYRAWADSLYFVVGSAAFLRIRPPHLRLTVDGGTLESTFPAALLCNLRTYAKHWAMAPDAHCQSGQLHYQARKRSLLPFMIWHLGAAALGEKSPAFISDYGAGSKLVVEAEKPLPVQVDGDFRGYLTRIELEIHPSAIEILTPAQIAVPAGV